MQRPRPKPKTKAPAYQFYPDKWESHTARLSDTSYRIYHRILNWMWLQSPNQYSITADEQFISFALAENPERIHVAIKEIQYPGLELLQTNNGKLTSRGLKKEATKQRERRVQTREAANIRWHNKLEAVRAHSERTASAQRAVCPISPTPTPTPSPSPSPTVVYKGDVSEEGADFLDLDPDVYKRHPRLQRLHKEQPSLRGMTLEQWLRIEQHRSTHMNWLKAIEFVLDKAALQPDIKKPAAFVDTYLGFFEKDHMREIALSQERATERDRELTDLATFIVEGGAGTGSVDRQKTRLEKKYGPEFVAAAERKAVK